MRGRNCWRMPIYFPFPSIQKTPDDAKAIVNDMLKQANVDPQRLYIVGQKADAAMIQTLLHNSPGLWRGAVLMQPSEFPKFQDSPAVMPSFLVFWRFKWRHCACVEGRTVFASRLPEAGFRPVAI
jgi:hypothetical protein